MLQLLIAVAISFGCWILAGDLAAVSGFAGAFVVVTSTVFATAVWWLIGGRNAKNAGHALMAVLIGEGLRVVLAVIGLFVLFVQQGFVLSPGALVLGFCVTLVAYWVVFYTPA